MLCGGAGGSTGDLIGFTSWPKASALARDQLLRRQVGALLREGRRAFVRSDVACSAMVGDRRSGSTDVRDVRRVGGPRTPETQLALAAVA